MRTTTVIILLLFYRTAISQVQVSVFGGPQATTADYSVKGLKQDTKMKYGFHVGAGLKVNFEDKLYFAPSGQYSLKGYEVTYHAYVFPPSTEAINNDTRFHTFELALLLQYDFSNKPGHFFVKAGPLIDFQLSGKEKFKLMTGETISQNVKFSYGDYGHFAASLLGHFGYELPSGLFLSIHYAHGIGSINNADKGPSIKHQTYGLTIGKLLRKKSNQ